MTVYSCSNASENRNYSAWWTLNDCMMKVKRDLLIGKLHWYKRNKPRGGVLLQENNQLQGSSYISTSLHHSVTQCFTILKKHMTLEDVHSKHFLH